MWTGCHSRSYMAVTAHTINDDWKMKSFCLATHKIVDAHTADNIADELSAIITEWQLDTKVLGITTDNARNVKNAVDSLNFIHFGCIGHTLQLSVGRRLQLGFVSRVLGCVCKLVEHFHKSPMPCMLYDKSSSCWVYLSMHLYSNVKQGGVWLLLC